MAAFDSSGEMPIAPSTCDAATLPDEQAEPDETATPSRSKFISSVSAFIPRMAKFVVLQSRSTPSLKIITSSNAASSLSLNSKLSSIGSSASAAKPAMLIKFSVPARRRNSWPPPCSSGSTTKPSRIIKAPMPVGPPILWAATVIKSTPSNPKFT